MPRAEGEPLRIVVVGPNGCGKSSACVRFATKDFPSAVQETEPPKEIEGPFGNTLVIDTSNANEIERNEIISKAHGVILLADFNSENMIRDVTEVWMPLLELHARRIPRVFFINQSDIADQAKAEKTVETLEAVLQTQRDFFSGVIVGSCKLGTNFEEMFQHAQMQAIFPVGPLLERTTGGQPSLTAKCDAALRRVFAVFDKDHDGLLSDTETNAFQTRVFGMPLSDAELSQIKQVIAVQVPGVGVASNCLTPEGFLHLHKLFIVRERVEMVWMVLSSCGYNEDLEVDGKRLLGRRDAAKSGGAKTSLELTDSTVAFLRAKFAAAGSSLDKALEPCGDQKPFAASALPAWACEKDASGKVTPSGWVSLWARLAAENPESCVAALFLLGLDVQDPSSPAFVERAGEARNVFRAVVCGGPGSGRSTAVRALVGASATAAVAADGEASGAPSAQALSTVHTVDVAGKPCTIILTECAEASITESTLSRDAIDAVAITFDVTQTGSFAVAEGIYKRVQEGVPVLFFATKGAPGSDEEKLAISFCSSNGLIEPIGAHGSFDKDSLATIGAVAKRPHLAGVKAKGHHEASGSGSVGARDEVRSRESQSLFSPVAIGGGIAAAAVIVIAFFALRRRS